VGRRAGADVAAAALLPPSPLQPAAAAIPATRKVVTVGMLGKAAEALSQAALVLVAPRLLGPSDYGTFAVALAVVGLVSSSLSLGGPVVMSRFVPAAAPADRDAVARALTIKLAWWRAIKIALLAVLAVTLILVAPSRFQAGFTLLVLAALALDAVAALGFQAALGLGHTGVWSARWSVQNALVIAALIAGHALWGVHGAVAGIALASGCVLAWVAAVVGPRLVAAPRGGAIPDGLLRFVALEGLAGVFSVAVLRGGVPAVALLGAARHETAFAALALGIAAAALFAVWQIFTVQLPGLVASGRMDAAERTARRLGGQMVPVVTVIAAAGVLVAGPAIPLVFGSGYTGARDAVVLALAALPLAPLVALTNQTAALRLKPAARAGATCSGLVAFAAVAAVGVPLGGAVGGSAALVAAFAATVVAAARLLPGAFGRRLVLGALAAVAAVAILGLLT
jgi:O-antigen/teichoic acid export membrane protein